MKNSILKKRLIYLGVLFNLFFISGNVNSQTSSGNSDVQALAVCGIPTNLHITNLSSTSGRLIWNSVSTATNYVVRFRKVGSTAWRRQSTHDPLETIFGLLPNTQYEAKVRCDCGTTEGVYSGLFYFTTLSNGTCAIPDILYFTSGNITGNSALIGWKAIPAAISYTVQYRIRNSGSAWLFDTANTNSLTLNGLLPSTNYEFEIQSVCTNGSGNFSAPGVFTTISGNCPPPNNLSANNITDSSATLTWSQVNCATYYIVNYRQADSLWINDTTSQTSFDLSNLIADTVYEFNIQSVDSSGLISGLSPSYSFTTTLVTCGVASNLNDSIVTINSATLIWDAVTGANQYHIQYRLSGVSSWQIDSSLLNNITISGLSPNNTYEYRVKSVCVSSTGIYSPIESFTTLPNVNHNIPVPDHIVICILENKGYPQIIGNSLTPRINALANDSKSALFNESYGIGHPSQPNYIHLFSGGNQGVTSNNMPSNHFTTPNLARELINAGKTFKSYCEGLPSAGYDGNTSGAYARKHNPVANWMGSGNNQVSSTLNQPFTNFPTNYDLLPTVSIVVPDLNNSMHDGSVTSALPRGDNWVFQNLNSYIQWAKTHNSLFILTFDEDNGNYNNNIVTIFTGEMVVGSIISQPINHHNILRTIEEMYGLNFVGNSANVSSIHGCWTSGFRLANPDGQSPEISETYEGWELFPNPAKNELNIKIALKEISPVTIRIFSEAGAQVHMVDLGEVKEGVHTFTIPLTEGKYSAGTYFVQVVYGNKRTTQKVQISL